MFRLQRVGLMLAALALVGATACEKGEPEAVTVPRGKGNELLNANKYAEAAEQYALSLQADPKQEKVWERKAFCHMKAGDMDKAEESLLKLLEFRTEPAQRLEVYRNIASMYLQPGASNSEKAEKYFLEALKLKSDDEASMGWVAEIHAQRGGARNMNAPAVPAELDIALGYYDKLIEMKPNVPDMLFNKRIALIRYMDYEKKAKDAAEQEAKDNAKDATKVAEAKAKADAAQAKFDELKGKMDAVTAKLVEINKAAKAAKK